MSIQPAVLESAVSGRIRLQIDFRWLGDRFGHAISLVRGEAVRPLLESVEGTSNEAWPPSPPLASLHFESLASDRRVALLVGMAGRSHWSASIEPVPGRAALRFDIACRTSESSQCRSQYAILAAEGWRISAQDAQVQQAAAGIIIGPAHQAAAGATTVRWKYEISLDAANIAE